MKLKRTICIACITLASTLFSLAGSRPAEFSLVNVSKQPMNKEGERLFELIQKDLKMLYNDKKFGFGWETVGTTIQTVEVSKFKDFFKPMIILDDEKKFSLAMNKLATSDGLIVFEYDLKGKQVRLKHFSRNQKENILIRLPINEGGAMNLSLWKGQRRAALVALGHSFEFSP